MEAKFEQRSTSGCELVTEVARRFGEVRLRVTGTSMMPMVWPGDVLTVCRGKLAEMEPGQIMLYRRAGELVAHRVAHIDGDLLITRGDSIKHYDSPVRESDVVGRVVSVVRQGRAVDFDLTIWSRAGSHILRRSDFCLRAASFLARRLQHPKDEEISEISWA